MPRLSKDERREERARRRANKAAKHAELKMAGADARREYFWGNRLRQQRARQGR